MDNTQFDEPDVLEKTRKYKYLKFPCKLEVKYTNTTAPVIKEEEITNIENGYKCV